MQHFHHGGGHAMDYAARLVLHHARRFGILVVSTALFSAFVMGWLLGNVFQLISAFMPKGGRHDPIRLRMAQAVQRDTKYYDDILLHGRVT